MMKVETITAQWASITLTQQGGAVVGVQSRDANKCFVFESTEQLSVALKQKDLKIKKWILSVPDHYCLAKSVELPAVDVEQAFKMIEFELPSHIPVSPEDIVYGCIPSAQNESLLTVSVYAVKTNILGNILQRYRNIGGQPAKIITDSVAIQAWFGDMTESDQSIYLLGDDKGVSIYKQVDQCLKCERVKFDDEQANWKSHAFETLETLREEADPVKLGVKLVAHSVLQQDLKDLCKEVFDSVVDESGLPEIINYRTQKRLVSGEYISEAVIAQGMLKAAELTECNYLNLLPQKILKKRAQRRLITNFSVTVILCILVVSGLWFNFAVANWKMQRSCEKIIKQIEPIKDIAADVESRRQLIHAIQNQFLARNHISRILFDLYQHSPRQISISQMSYAIKDGNIAVNFRGQADTLSNAFEYSDAMKKSEMLKNLQIINVQQIPRPGGSIIEFQADCKVR